MAKLMKDFVRIENNFTIIPNEILRNKEMKSSTKNILLTMFGLPSDWDFSIAGISTCVYEGYETVQKSLVELEKIGYITRKRQRRENGTLGAMIYTIHQFPVSEEENTYKKNFSDQDVKKPKQVKTNAGKNQYREEPVQDSERQLSNDDKPSTNFKKRNDDEIRINNSLSSERANESESTPTKRQNRKKEANDFFERVWKLYPKKIGKGQVSDTQKLRLLDIGYNELERAVQRCCEYNKDKDKQYWQNGSTFFNSGYIDFLDENYQDCNSFDSKAPETQAKKEKLRMGIKKAKEKFGEEYGEDYWSGMDDEEMESTLAFFGIFLGELGDGIEKTT